MKAKIIGHKFTCIIDIENAVCIKESSQFLEVSANNGDAYRFTLSENGKNEVSSFIRDCENFINNLLDDRKYVVLTLTDYQIKFEKSSVSSHIH